MFRLHINAINTTNKISHMFGSMPIRFIAFGPFSSVGEEEYFNVVNMKKILCEYGSLPWRSDRNCTATLTWQMHTQFCRVSINFKEKSILFKTIRNLRNPTSGSAGQLFLNAFYWGGYFVELQMLNVIFWSPTYRRPTNLDRTLHQISIRLCLFGDKLYIYRFLSKGWKNWLVVVDVPQRMWWELLELIGTPNEKGGNCTAAFFIETPTFCGWKTSSLGRVHWAKAAITW